MGECTVSSGGARMRRFRHGAREEGCEGRSWESSVFVPIGLTG